MTDHDAHTQAASIVALAALTLSLLSAGCDSNDDGASMAGSGDIVDPLVMDDPLAMEDPQATDDSPTSMFVIDRDNHIDLLTQVFEVFVGDVIGEPIESTRLRILVQTSGDDGYGTVPTEYVCMNGGTLLVAAENTFRFDDCQISDVIHDGPVEAPFERDGWVVTSRGLTIRTEPDRLVEFSGTAFRSFSQSNSDHIGRWEMINVDFRSVDTAGAFVIASANTAFVFGETPGLFRGALEGEFTFRSPLTQNQAVDVTTPDAFIYPDDDTPTASERHFVSGVLRLSAADGNTLVFDVGTGDEETVAIALTLDGETETFAQPWSLWPNVRLREPQSAAAYP